MKKTKQQLGCMLILICLILVLLPSTQANPSLYISSYSIYPEILHPGDTAILQITISNGETTATETDADYYNNLLIDQTVDTIGAIIENIYITPDGDGVSNVKATKNYKNPVEIAPGSSITLDFIIQAESNISSGIYTPLVHINLKSDSFHDVTFPIAVQVTDESIDLIPQQKPSSISNIGETDISFLFVNNRANDISNIRITPHRSEKFKITPSTSFISSLSGLGSEMIHFSIIPNTTGNFVISINCSYKNGENNHNEIFEFPLNISSFYEVYPIIYSEPNTLEKGEIEEIRLKLYNAKNSEINSVRIKPITDAHISPKEYFIGSMDADDLYAVTFDISADDLQDNKSYPISYEISFKQNNNVYTNIALTSSVSIQAKNSQNGTGLVLVGVIGFFVILVIIGILYFRKRRGST